MAQSKAKKSTTTASKGAVKKSATASVNSRQPTSVKKVAKATARKTPAAGKATGAKATPAAPAARKPAAGKVMPGKGKQPAVKKAAGKAKPAAHKPAVKKKAVASEAAAGRPGAGKAEANSKTPRAATPGARKALPDAPAQSPKRRAVAASHRPQSATVSVPARSADSNGGGKAAPNRRKSAPAAGPLTEEMLRKASESDYMSEAQLHFFQERLLQMRNEVLARELDVKERLHQREVFADPADRASAEEEHWLDLRLRERESLLLKKIDESLRRIRDKEYGYCEKTGEAIGIARLLARPTATVCVDIKGQSERAESQYRDR